MTVTPTVSCGETVAGHLPKLIWFFWMQGWAQTPHFIKLNFLSWASRNPGWRVIFLEQGNIARYTNAEQIIENNRPYITPTSFSDVLRIDLLHRYGGIWADATVLCMMPLDCWIDAAIASSGFFCFRNYSPDRDISSWFMAACRDNQLIRKWHDLTWQYWRENVFENQKRIDSRPLQQRFNVNLASTKGWFHSSVTKDLKIYPYFWFHYLHTRAVEADAAAASVWGQTPEIGGGNESAFLRTSPLEPPSEWSETFLARPNLRMLKLERRSMPETFPEGSVVEALYAPLKGIDMPNFDEGAAVT